MRWNNFPAYVFIITSFHILWTEGISFRRMVFITPELRLLELTSFHIVWTFFGSFWLWYLSESVLPDRLDFSSISHCVQPCIRTCVPSMAPHIPNLIFRAHLYSKRTNPWAWLIRGFQSLMLNKSHTPTHYRLFHERYFNLSHNLIKRWGFLFLNFPKT